MNKGKIEIYTSNDNQIELQVQLNQETVWLNRQQLSLLFDRDIKTIGKHINNVFKEGELNENQAVAKFATTAKDSKIYQVDYYNLDVFSGTGFVTPSRTFLNCEHILTFTNP